MQCKAGADHIQSLRDGRTVYLDGQQVDNVTTHPAFRNAVACARLDRLTAPLLRARADQFIVCITGGLLVALFTAARTDSQRIAAISLSRGATRNVG